MRAPGPGGGGGEAVRAGPSPADLLEPIAAYQRSAVIGAAVETGIADALYAGARSEAEVAEATGTDPRGALALLGAMVAQGLALRGGSGFELSPAGCFLAAGHPASVAGIVRKEWFFYRVWAELPEAVRDGHARIAPWRRRLADDPATSLDFLRALDDLASMFGGELPELAALSGPGRLLDAGGGAGSHAAALVAECEGLEATVLDLPEVEALVRERHPELRFVAGDLERPRFGRPEEEEWDAVLLANVLHDHPAARCSELVREAAGLLRPGGTLLIYEWVIAADRVSPSEVAMFTPMMLVENEGGWTWTAEELGAWVREAGLEPLEPRRGAGPISVLSARKPG